MSSSSSTSGKRKRTVARCSQAESAQPALVRLAHAFPPERIARVLDGHTAAGHHVSRSIPFPAWVAPVVKQEADALGEEQARAVLGECLARDSGAVRR